MGKEKIPQSEHMKIIEMYKNGTPQPVIAEKYGVGRTTISYILCKYNIHRKDRRTTFDKYKREMCDMYDKGYTVKEIADFYKVNDESLRKKLNSWGVSMRHSAYTANEHYFDVIDDQNKAYIIGFFWADGYNNVSRNTVLMTLQEGDGYILEEINKLLENTHPLDYLNVKKMFPNSQNTYRMAVTGEHMSKTLERYGMVQAKSLVLDFPACVPEDLYPALVRGYLDGDGYIGKNTHEVMLVGTEMFLSKVQQWCSDVLNIESHLIKIKGKSEVLRRLKIWKKEHVKKFLDCIYKDANLYLKRKYDIYVSKYCSEENIDNTLTA